MNISYNNFKGVVSKKLSSKDALNMTMLNDQGVATTLLIDMSKDKAVVSEE
jgi:hypothetical protein